MAKKEVFRHCGVVMDRAAGAQIGQSSYCWMTLDGEVLEDAEENTLENGKNRMLAHVGEAANEIYRSRPEAFGG